MQAQSLREGARALQIRDFLHGRGFHACDSEAEIAAFRVLAQRLLPVEVATLDTLRAVQARTGHSLFLHQPTVGGAGFLAFCPLSPRGERAILQSDTSLRPDWVEPFTTSTRRGYVWGLGGETRGAQFAVLRALSTMRASFFPHVGLYARATTAEGKRAMDGFGYAVPINETAGIFYAPPLIASLAAAS